jgi:hypothetical protein
MGVILTRQRCPIPLQSGNIAFWWDIADPNGDGALPSTGTTLSTLVDKSGNKFNANQPSGANEATFYQVEQNGLPGLYFTHNLQTYYDTDPLDLTDSFTIYLSINSQSTDTYSVFDTAIADLPEFNFNSGTNQYGAGNYDGVVNRGFQWAPSTTFEPHIMCYRYDSAGGFGQMFIDNFVYDPVSNANVSAAGLIPRRLGGHPNAGVFYEGWLFESFANFGADTDDVITRNLRYLGNKWGILKP